MELCHISCVTDPFPAYGAVSPTRVSIYTFPTALSISYDKMYRWHWLITRWIEPLCPKSLNRPDLCPPLCCFNVPASFYPPSSAPEIPA